MSETMQSECVITGDTSSKNEHGHLKDIIGRKVGKPFINMTGQRFGRLEVITRGPNNKGGQATWKCRCDCGNYTALSGWVLRSGQSKSCGCFKQELVANHYGAQPYKWILAQLVNVGSSRRHRGESNMEMTMTYEDILEFVKIPKCQYCGNDVVWNPHRSSAKKQVSAAYNLDRKDNSVGYTIDNCVVCCATCNYFKGNRFSYDEMVEIGKTFHRLRELRESRGQSWVQHYLRLSPIRETSLTKAL